MMMMTAVVAEVLRLELKWEKKSLEIKKDENEEYVIL